MTPRTLIAAVATVAAGVAGAVEPTTITIWQNGNEVASKAICNDSELTFGNALTFFYTPGSEGEVFELNEHTVLTFNGRSGVNGIQADMGAFTLRSNPVGSTLELIGPSGMTTDLEIFAIYGARVINIPAWQGESVDVAALTPGVYILKLNNQTIKFIKS